MGRRVYIHSYSFKNLALRQAAAGHLIVGALLRTKAAKMINDQIVEDGQAFKYLSPEAARAFRRATSKCFSPAITQAMKLLGFRPTEPSKRSQIWPVLHTDEAICATCYEDGYFTFATSQRAALEMFNDTERIQVLRERVRTGAAESLTIIRGRNLVLLRPELNERMLDAKSYVDILGRKTLNGEKDLGALQSDVCDTILTEVTRELLTTAQEVGTEQSFVKAKVSIISNSLEYPLFD